MARLTAQPGGQAGLERLKAAQGRAVAALSDYRLRLAALPTESNVHVGAELAHEAVVRQVQPSGFGHSPLAATSAALSRSSTLAVPPVRAGSVFRWRRISSFAI